MFNYAFYRATLRYNLHDSRRLWKRNGREKEKLMSTLYLAFLVHLKSHIVLRFSMEYSVYEISNVIVIWHEYCRSFPTICLQYCPLIVRFYYGSIQPEL